MAPAEAAPARGGPPGPGMLAAWAALSGVLLVLLAVWQGHGYWEYSDGVYSLSARQLLDGQSLYREFAAAQPPALYYLGAGVLALADSPTSIRIAMALCEAGVSLLVLVAVRRLTRWPAIALATAIISFVTPWALREHAQLLPETIAAPLIMAAALAGSARRTSTAAGALGALATMLKLAFFLPALGVVLCSRDVRRSLRGYAGTGAVGALVLLGLFGAPLWTDVVRAQAQSGQAAVGYVLGLWSQAGWNLLPLVALAGLAWAGRAAVYDRALVRSLLGAALGSALLLGTLFKNGSYLTVMVLVEPPMLCFAACGVALTLRDAAGPRRARTVVMLAAGALSVAQLASLVISPASPTVFTRPFAASGPARVLSSSAVQRVAAAIRRCPLDSVYAGPPYLAFVADRPIAGDQPDQFIIAHAPVLARFRRAAATGRPVCPPPGRLAPGPAQ